MTQTDNLRNKIKNKLESIEKRLESYEKVDATLTNETLIHTLINLNFAEDSLERGFVKDSCNEIEENI